MRRPSLVRQPCLLALTKDRWVGTCTKAGFGETHEPQRCSSPRSSVPLATATSTLRPARQQVTRCLADAGTTRRGWPLVCWSEVRPPTGVPGRRRGRTWKRSGASANRLCLSSRVPSKTRWRNGMPKTSRPWKDVARARCSPCVSSRARRITGACPGRVAARRSACRARSHGTAQAVAWPSASPRPFCVEARRRLQG